MKELRNTFLLLMVSIILLSACKKSKPNSSIIGSWKITSMITITFDSSTSTSTFTDSSYTPDNTDVAIFGSDNSLTVLEFSESQPSLLTTGNYYLVGREAIIFTGANTTGEIFNYAVSGNSLILSSFTSSPGSSITVKQNYIRQ